MCGDGRKGPAKSHGIARHAKGGDVVAADLVHVACERRPPGPLAAAERTWLAATQSQQRVDATRAQHPGFYAAWNRGLVHPPARPSRSPQPGFGAERRPDFGSEAVGGDVGEEGPGG